MSRVDLLSETLSQLEGLSVPQTRRLAKRIVKENKESPEKIKNLALLLLKKNNASSKRLGVNLLLSLPNVSFEEYKKVVFALADDSDWEIKEEAAMAIRHLLLHDFKKWLLVLKEMVKSKSANLRRAAVVGSMQTKLKEDQVRKIAFYIYQPLLTDENEYVRKNLGPFALSDFFLRVYPKLALRFFDKWIKTGHLRVIWNILNAFQISRLKKGYWDSHFQSAQKYLKMVEKDQEKTVQQAVKSLKRRMEKVKNE